MDGVRAGDGGGGEDGGDVEVAVLARRRPDADRFVGEAHVHGTGVGGGVHRHRLDPHLAAGAVDAERDLSAVGNEDLVEHRCRAAYSITSSGSPYRSAEHTSALQSLMRNSYAVFCLKTTTYTLKQST